MHDPGWHARWRKGEMEQAARELERVGRSLAVVATFLADHGSEEDRGEVAELQRRGAALLARVQALATSAPDAPQ